MSLDWWLALARANAITRIMKCRGDAGDQVKRELYALSTEMFRMGVELWVLRHPGRWNKTQIERAAKKRLVDERAVSSNPFRPTRTLILTEVGRGRSAPVLQRVALAGTLEQALREIAVERAFALVATVKFRWRGASWSWRKTMQAATEMAALRWYGVGHVANDEQRLA